MTETRLLKNVAISFQTILSSVLSRKINNNSKRKKFYWKRISNQQGIPYIAGPK